MKKGYITTTLFLLLLSTFMLLWATDVYAGQQENVNYIINKIRSKLNVSLNSAGWQSDYKVVGMNIEDLRKTLAQGGKITSNPVQEHYTLLTQMLDERKAEFKMYCDMQEKLQKNRKKAASQAINDVGMEMISRLQQPKPGVLSPITQAQTKNAAVIRQDFARLKNIDDAIKTLEGYKNSIIPSIHAIRDRKHALSPLVAQYATLTAAAFDGTYTGSFRGNASGSISFTVKGNRISGKMSGSHKGDSIKGSFTGTVDSVGNISAKNTGTLTDSSSAKLGTFSFAGSVSGKISGAMASGAWDAKNKWGAPAGSWSASKIR